MSDPLVSEVGSEDRRVAEGSELSLGCDSAREIRGPRQSTVARMGQAGIESGRRSSVSDYDLIPEPHRDLMRLYNEGLQYLKDLLDLGLSDCDEAELKLSGLKRVANDWHDLIDERREALSEPHPGGWGR